MPDQVPRSLQVGQGGSLPLPLLHAVLAEMTQARFVGTADGFGRLRFRNANQSNLIASPASFLRGRDDALLHTNQIVSNLPPISHDSNRSMRGVATPNTSG
jgi:hypothetical protein